MATLRRKFLSDPDEMVIGRMTMEPDRERTTDVKPLGGTEEILVLEAIPWVRPAMGNVQTALALAMAGSLAVILAACGAIPLASPLESGASVPSEAVGTTSCQPIELLTPSGQQLDLTGTWSGDSALFFVAQEGDCVAWEELSQGPELGSRFRRVFSGRLATDFTVAGTFVVTYASPQWVVPGAGFVVPRSGEAEYQVSIEVDGLEETITLTGPSRESTDFGVFETVTLIQMSPSTAYPQ